MLLLFNIITYIICVYFCLSKKICIDHFHFYYYFLQYFCYLWLISLNLFKNNIPHILKTIHIFFVYAYIISSKLNIKSINYRKYSVINAFENSKYPPTKRKQRLTHILKITSSPWNCMLDLWLQSFVLMKRFI